MGEDLGPEWYLCWASVLLTVFWGLKKVPGTLLPICVCWPAGLQRAWGGVAGGWGSLLLTLCLQVPSAGGCTLPLTPPWVPGATLLAPPTRSDLTVPFSPWGKGLS